MGEHRRGRRRGEIIRWVMGRTERGNGGCGYGARVEGGRVGLVKGEGGKMGWGEEDEAGRARGRTEQEVHGVYWADVG